MKAVLYQGKQELIIKEICPPTFNGDGAIIKVKGCGLCGSDIVKIKHGMFSNNGVPGHEVVGIIDKIGYNEVFNQGDRVVLGHHVPCFNCVYCLNENYSMCREFKRSNIIPGGFCEYIHVSESHLLNTVLKVPDSISDIQASFTEPASCCLRAVKRASVKQGDIVFVIGLGSIGLIMGQILKHYGAKVIGCDLMDERINFANNLGFDAVYKYTNDNEIAGMIKSDFRSEGVDKVFLTSGNAKSIDLSTLSVRDGGVILVFASVSSEEAGFNNNEIYYRELSILGSYSPSPQDLRDSLKLISENIVKTQGISTEYGLKDINIAINDTCSNKIFKAYIYL